jgi:hypothetical protein
MTESSTKPKWVDPKPKDEELIFVGEMGVAGVIDGKLPNGEPYEWSKQNRKHKRRLRKPKL